MNDYAAVGHHNVGRGAMDMKFCIRYTKPRTFVQLVIPTGRGEFQTYTAVIDNVKIANSLRQSGVKFRVSGNEVSGLFGKIWKSVKKIAKKTGITKVIKLARKALPFVAKFAPPPFSTAAMGASLALETAADLTRARKSRKRGRKGRSARYIQRALGRAKKYGKIIGKRRRKKALKAGARMYRIMVSPT